MPDNENPGHYLDPLETPNDDRFPDDWQPRANIKKAFDSGEPNLEREYGIEEFSKKFAVEEKLVQEYVHHIKDIKHRADMRAVHRIKINEKLKEKNMRNIIGES